MPGLGWLLDASGDANLWHCAPVSCRSLGAQNDLAAVGALLRARRSSTLGATLDGCSLTGTRFSRGCLGQHCRRRFAWWKDIRPAFLVAGPQRASALVGGVATPASSRRRCTAAAVQVSRCCRYGKWMVATHVCGQQWRCADGRASLCPRRFGELHRSAAWRHSVDGRTGRGQREAGGMAARARRRPLLHTCSSARKLVPLQEGIRDLESHRAEVLRHCCAM
mmetsp:Transcript_30145/g.82848  ORF Transcript_30145/g.82848 Transcript_30145/m.82848 type:complete len:222 (+) Transcript_30145:300-965(+)